MKKKHKHHSHKKTCFIDKEGGMSIEQYLAQSKNIEENKRLADKMRQKKGKIKK